MKDLWKKREGRDAARETWRRIGDKLDARLESILTEEQVVIYRERRERERRWWAEQKERFKKNGDRKKKHRSPEPPRPESGEREKPAESPPTT